ncbi:MAG: hypothetical protein COA79_21795 [Planctomycetota bacterium]|nr:MAG: hypothetical protein COA79_21795 [Planctomycetota bacterium]
MIRFVAVLFCLSLFLIKTNCDDKNTDFTKIIAHSKEKVFPALVFIKTIVENLKAGNKVNKIVFGSGVIISEDGYVITNHHVIDKAKSITCILSDKRRVKAEIIGSDKDTDIALIKLDIKEKVPFAKLGDSDKVIEGQFVLAMGAPFGFSRSISFGLISYTKRYLKYSPYTLWLQTDAAINPGNSGGPLVNTKGLVIGINTLGGRNNIGFSVPSNKVKDIIDQLKIHGKNGVPRTWTGITFQALKDFNTDVILDANNGVLVAGVRKNSPASEAGLKVGDIITKCNDKDINAVYLEDLPEIRTYFSKLKTDSIAKLVIKRGKQILDLPMKLKLKGKVEGNTFEAERWNMTFKEINKFESPIIAYFKNKGVFVLGVDHTGNAAKYGFQRNDIILEIENKKIEVLSELKSIYNDSLKLDDGKKKLIFKIMRKGTIYHIAFDFRIDYKKVKEDE